MTPQRTLDMPGDATHVDEAASILHEHTAGDASAFIRHAWRWAGSVSSSQAQAETAYFAVLAAGGVDPPPAEQQPAAEQAAKPDPAPKPKPETEPDEPDADAEQPRAPAATPTSEPLPGDLLRRLEALTQRVEAEPTTTAGQVPKWDPEETPTLTGQVAITEWADLRQRAGPVRILTLRTAHGPLLVWCSYQQFAALLRNQELAHGRPLQAGDLLAIQARGKQRVGKSRSPSRLFCIAIDWTP